MACLVEVGQLVPVVGRVTGDEDVEGIDVHVHNAEGVVEVVQGAANLLGHLHQIVVELAGVDVPEECEADVAVLAEIGEEDLGGGAVVDELDDVLVLRLTVELDLGPLMKGLISVRGRVAEDGAD